MKGYVGIGYIQLTLEFQEPNITETTFEPGMVIQPLIGNPYSGYINPYYWVDEFIPYYMEIMELIDPSTCGSCPKKVGQWSEKKSSHSANLFIVC